MVGFINKLLLRNSRIFSMIVCCFYGNTDNSKNPCRPDWHHWIPLPCNLTIYILKVSLQTLFATLFHLTKIKHDEPLTCEKAVGYYSCSSRSRKIRQTAGRHWCKNVMGGEKNLPHIQHNEAPWQSSTMPDAI